MSAPDSIKQIVFRPLGSDRTGRAALEISLESGRVHQEEIQSDAFMRAIAEMIRYERALKPSTGSNITLGGS